MATTTEVGKVAQKDPTRVRPKRLRDIDLNFKQILIIMAILWLWVIGGYFLWSVIQ